MLDFAIVITAGIVITAQIAVLFRWFQPAGWNRTMRLIHRVARLAVVRDPSADAGTPPAVK